MNKPTQNLTSDQAPIIEIYEAGLTQKLPFPETFRKLQSTKLSSYEVTTATGEHVFKIGIKRFYGQYGAPKTANKTGTYEKTKAFQVLVDHAKSNSTFESFLTKLAAAGVGSYVVNIKTGQCTYYAADKTASFTEQVPQTSAPVAKAKTSDAVNIKTETAIIDVYKKAMDGTPFPITFKSLKALGVTYYVAHIERDAYEFHTEKKRHYFTPRGKHHGGHKIAEFNLTKAKQVVKAKHPTYAHFVAQLRKAGVHEYEVSITNKTCTYYGADRINHFVEKIKLPK